LFRNGEAASCHGGDEDGEDSLSGLPSRKQVVAGRFFEEVKTEHTLSQGEV
jgi:hypothetical protein